MTYSIVAFDPATGELGAAVQSRWFGVGSASRGSSPGVGAVATQSFTEVGHGPNGLRLMREGRTAAEALAEVLASDPGEAVRQVGMVDASGNAAAHTGSRCVRYASHLVGDGVAAQANMMERSTVPAAMLAAFGGTDGDLAARLLAALVAAEGEGGDVRGRQSAALVVAPGAGDGSTPQPWARRFDVRVEDHRSPVDELARVLSVARAYEAMDEAEAAGGRATWRPRRRRASGRGPWRPTTTRSCCGTPSAWSSRDGSRRRAPSWPGPRRSSRVPASTCAGSPSRVISPAATPSCGPSVSADAAAAPAPDKRMRPAAPRLGAGRPVAESEEARIRLFFSCVFGCSSVVRPLRFSGPSALHRVRSMTGILRVRAARTPPTDVANRAGQMT